MADSLSYLDNLLVQDNKQLLDEVEHDIVNYQKPRSVLSAEAEG